MGVKERLEEYILYKGLKKREFSRMVGKSPAFVTNISKGISNDVLNSISNQFPDLNVTWLLTGKEDMILRENAVSTEKSVEISKEAWGVLKEQATIMSRQMDSIVMKDNQINDLIEMLKHLIYNKKTEGKICVG
ncbi:MAG: hypothetical protein UHS50_04240 [Bacteroidaceae bacterium]|nr:hypothetical protein [Bacteroidaceae bacterium]